MKKLFLVVLFVSTLFSQPKNKDISGYLFDVNFISNGNDNFLVYYSFKIQYDNLIFKLNKDSYFANFRFSLEIKDKDNNIVKRIDNRVEVFEKDFEETNSKFNYSSGVFSFEIKSGEYSIIPNFEDLNASKEYSLTPYKLDINSTKETKYLRPLFVNNIKCKNDFVFSVLNFDKKVPFQQEFYDMIIPVLDSSTNSINVKIINNKKEIYNSLLTSVSKSSFEFNECENNITFGNGDKNIINIFRINEISNLFEEGELIINLSDNNYEEIFEYEVFWFNKPLSLSNPDFSIKILKYIENEVVIKSLRNNKKEDYYKVLVEYWKKFDPIPQTLFNELMSEFYQRVDYSYYNFSTLNGKNGAETDRGKIYITNGKPNKIERDRNNKGKVSEIWVYENPSKQFWFVDNNGTGEYILIK